MRVFLPTTTASLTSTRYPLQRITRTLSTPPTASWCPQGWKVPTSAQYKRLVSQIANGSSIKKDGGALLRYDTSDNDKCTYIRFTGYWYTATHFSGIGEYTLLWCGDDISKGSGYDSGAGGFYFRVDNKPSTSIITTGHQCAALSLRCIQERDWSVR